MPNLTCAHKHTRWLHKRKNLYDRGYDVAIFLLFDVCLTPLFDQGN
jgi:hypothetical protein